MTKLKAIFKILFSSHYFVATYNRKKSVHYFYTRDLFFMFEVDEVVQDELDELIDAENAVNTTQQIIDNLN